MTARTTRKTARMLGLTKNTASTKPENEPISQGIHQLMTSLSQQPYILPVFWQTHDKLDASFSEALKIFYNRIPFFEVGEQPFLTGPDLNHLLRQASEHPGIRWVAVISIGNIFGSQLEIVRQVENCVNSLEEDVLICGHVQEKSGSYCGLEQKFFLVNAKRYKQLGFPRFGEADSQSRVLQNYEAGRSDDDGAVNWLAPKSTRQEYRTNVPGWGLIEASLQAGLKVFGLPSSLRDVKVFIHPDEETEKLNRNIRRLHEWEDLGSISQRQALAHLILKKLNLSSNGRTAFDFSERSNCVFFFNTESLLPHEEEWRDRGRGPLDVYSGPCSGFQDVAFLKYYGFHDETRLVLFDINNRALRMKNMIYDEFDGRIESLPNLLAKIRDMNQDEEVYSGFMNLKVEELLQIFDNDPESLRRTWKRIQALPREIMKLNLLGQSEKLFAKFKSGDTVMLNVTDIFLGQNELIYGYHGMIDKFTNFRNRAAQFENLMLVGKSVNQVRFLDFARNLNVAEI